LRNMISSFTLLLIPIIIWIEHIIISSTEAVNLTILSSTFNILIIALSTILLIILSIIIAKSLIQVFCNTIVYILLIILLNDLFMLYTDIGTFITLYLLPVMMVLGARLFLYILSLIRGFEEELSLLTLKKVISRKAQGSTLYSLLEIASIMLVILYLTYKISHFNLLGNELYFAGLCSFILFIAILCTIDACSKYMSFLLPLSWLAIPLSLSYILDFRVQSIVKEYEKGIPIGYTKATLSNKSGKLWDKIPQPTIKKKYTWRWIKVPKEAYCYDVTYCENPHILICGATGTGKSTLASLILKYLYEYLNINFLVFDHHGEYERLLNSMNINFQVLNPMHYSINILELDGLSPRAKSIELADIIQRIFRLGPLQRMVLEELFEETYAMYNIFEEDPSTWNNPPPKLFDVLKVIRIRKEASTNKLELAKLNSIEPYIRQLTHVIFAETTIPLDYIISNNIVIDLSKIPSETTRCIYTEALLRKIYYKLSSIQPGNIRFFIVVDEAHRLTRRGGREPSLLARLVMESRKYGLGFIIITQQPKDLDPSIIGNTATLISFKLSEPENVEYLSRVISGYSESGRIDVIKKALYYIPPYHAVFRGCRNQEPLILEIKIETL